MKRIIPTLLLMGYIALVPFCLFGASTMANMSSQNMIGQSPEMGGGCGVPVAGCAQASNDGMMGNIVHHISMYLSLTQTPLAAMIAVILFAFMLVCSAFLLRQLIEIQHSLHFARVVYERPHNDQRQVLLSWLSLFETSPNFA